MRTEERWEDRNGLRRTEWLYLSKKARMRAVLFRGFTNQRIQVGSPKDVHKIIFYAYKTARFHINIMGYNTG
jgi:hypothetical protein